MSGLFAGTSLERPVTCEHCEKPIGLCTCPRSGDGKLAHAKDQPLRVQRESRRGKTVTMISGFSARESDLAPLLKELKTKFATGGNLSAATIELQGDHRDKLVAHLRTIGYTQTKPSGG